MKTLLSIILTLLLFSCSKEDIQVKSACIKIKLYADNGPKGKQVLDSSVIYIGRSFKDTANTAKQANDLSINYRGSNYAVSIMNVDSVPLSIERPILTNYMLQFEMDNIPYDIDKGKYLVLFDAAKEASGETVIKPGLIGLSGTRMTEYYFQDKGYVSLSERFAVMYKK